MELASSKLEDRALLNAFSELDRVEAPSGLLPNVLYSVGIADLYWQADSPVGPLYIAAGREGITSVMRTDAREWFESSYRSRFGREARFVEEPPAGLTQDVGALLRGDRKKPLRYDLSGLSEFEQSVLRKAMEIPRGQVRPYSWVAREIGHPKAARAVGTALAGNPIPLLIPCHRVVRGDGAIGNYLFGTKVKRSLLEYERADPSRLESLAREGIRFVGSDSTKIFCFPTCRYHVSDEHRVRFGSEQEARARGYRPCKVCRPALAS
jgi:O-6-methylguanine DNA methyltransferase